MKSTGRTVLVNNINIKTRKDTATTTDSRRPFSRNGRELLRIGVVIPARNEALFIKDCIKSLKTQAGNPPEFIVVVDGNSSDSTARLARSEGAIVLKNSGTGPASARNKGAAFLNARGAGVIAFIDADTIAPPYWAQRIREHFNSRQELIGVGGPYVPYDGRKKDKRIYSLVTLGMRLLTIFGLPQFYGGNCAFRTKEFIKSGGFNEKLSLLEDVELSMRIRKLGKMIFDKQLIAFTSCRRYKQTGYLKPAYQTIRSYVSFITKTPYRTDYFEEIEKRRKN